MAICVGQLISLSLILRSASQAETPQLVRCGRRMIAAPIGYLVSHVADLVAVLAGLAHACRSVVAG
jgi:hypothetical protein